MGCPEKVDMRFTRCRLLPEGDMRISTCGQKYISLLPEGDMRISAGRQKCMALLPEGDMRIST